MSLSSANPKRNLARHYWLSFFEVGSTSCLIVAVLFEVLQWTKWEYISKFRSLGHRSLAQLQACLYLVKACYSTKNSSKPKLLSINRSIPDLQPSLKVYAPCSFCVRSTLSTCISTWSAITSLLLVHLSCQPVKSMCTFSALFTEF